MPPNLSANSPRRRSHAVAWSLALVLGCGLLLGYFVLKTYFAPKHRQYQLDFGDAQWIEPADGGPTAYFRTKVFITGTPEQAWLEVAGTDNFRAIVNSHTVGVEDSVKTRVAGIYDIKKRLKAGTNVIAVSVSRTSYPGAAQVVVRGMIKERGGNVVNLRSDEQWRVATETGIVRGSEDWTSEKVQDEQWPGAVLADLKGKPDLAWVDMNPLILQTAPSASWINSQNAASEATFSTTLKANHLRQETWLQIASSGDLDLVINGHLITSAIDSSNVARLPHLPAKEAPLESDTDSRAKLVKHAGAAPPKASETSFEKAILSVFDISYWIRSGDNSIVATVRADHRPASLFVAGFLVNRDGSLQRFASNSDWQARDRFTNDSSKDSHAVDVGENGSAPWGYLAQELAKPIDRSGFASFLQSWFVVCLIAAIVMAIWLLVSGLAAQRTKEELRRTMVRDALFHAPLGVALVFLLLPNYDLRFPAAWAFEPGFILAAIVVLLGVRLFHFFPIAEFGG
ncbi:MAG TPA: hypothetical protein VK474_00630, partial [Chthoniobacterales bacterium]|nr:hypothetical protein [Chthoniobacterales bacterium]